MEKSILTVPIYFEVEEMSCKICESSKNVTPFKGNYICEACITYIKGTCEK